MHYEELQICALWMGHVSETDTEFWGGEPGGKRLLETPTHRCRDDIKVGLKETGWEGVDWILLV